MEEAQLLSVPRRLQRGLQTDQLPVEHLGAVGSPVLLIEPAPGATQGSVSVEMAVVMEDVQGGESVLLEERLHLAGGGPPVVVVALEEELASPGQRIQEREVLLRLLQAHPPGDIAAYHHGVLLGHHTEPLFQLVHIPCPAPSEHVHRLVGGQGQMGVSNGIQGHGLTPAENALRPPSGLFPQPG